MEEKKEYCMIRHYRTYLIFMLIACGGAFIWQFLLPNMSGRFASWQTSIGWQREIALWNIGIIGAIIVALARQNVAYMKILTLQSTMLCLLLGINHLISLIMDFSSGYILHIMGVFEVLLLGGAWGTILLCKYRKKRE